MRRGFTMIDFLVSVAVFLAVVGLVTVNLNSGYLKVAGSGELVKLVSDLRSQQLKAMLGDTEGRVSPTEYGVYLGTTEYVLFYGSSYVPGASDNFVVVLPGDLEFANVTMLNREILFARGSGEVADYLEGFDGWQLISPGGGKITTFQINRYGVVSVL